MTPEQEKQMVLMGLTICQLKIGLNELCDQFKDLEKEYTAFTNEEINKGKTCDSVAGEE